ncbi:hydrogenase formation protein HypD [Desulfatirhabdium butyrativorans]|uniref:hydrogenase formation protein HypD n=1 Tax=Desulfatirhabdium butyrativorans TaxID=340467 RepID=UPI00040F7627|nr:hydrogenase formation protein HypD [Desulfatirhabdium butyrativorans]
MTITHAEEYREPQLVAPLIERIRRRSRKPVRLMEVCGTHTVSIFRSGIRSLLPETITLLSGPGCPVCVTAQRDIDACIALAAMPGVMLTTFGDLMRVPGSHGSLRQEKAAGHDIRIVYSAMDALELAAENPDRNVVFIGIGFETTAPTVAAAIAVANQRNIRNFLVYSVHKTVPQALEALVNDPETRIDGFLLPGHVSVITGLAAYRPFVSRHAIPCVVAGFEPADILLAIAMLIDQMEDGRAALENAYPRAVTEAGNAKAKALMQQVFEPVDAIWRGLGQIPASGLGFRGPYRNHDAAEALRPDPGNVQEPAACACGDVLKGIKTPLDCPLFGTACTPMHPVGPCMVSSEGTCAAYFRYHPRT